MDALPQPVQRVAGELARLGLPVTVRQFRQSTRTAQEAAQAIGCQVGQIVKSLVFVAGAEPLLVLASGARRVNEERLAAVAGAPARRASADEAKEATGFPIGAIPPVGHVRRLRTFIDPELMRYEVVWAAAGAPTAVFPIAPAQLQRITGAAVVPITDEAPT